MAMTRAPGLSVDTDKVPTAHRIGIALHPKDKSMVVIGLFNEQMECLAMRLLDADGAEDVATELMRRVEAICKAAN